VKTTSPASWRKRSKPLLSCKPGYTLFEIILVLSILVLLAGVTVVSLHSMFGDDLEDAASMFTTAIRFAGAESASVGRRIRMDFPEDPAIGQSSTMIMIEPDPLGQPGVFEEYTRCTWTRYLDDRIRIVESRLTGESAYRVVEDKSFEDEDAISPVTFYPDGSSDSVRIIVMLRADDEERAAVITVDGFNGTVTSDIRTTEELQEDYGDISGMEGS